MENMQDLNAFRSFRVSELREIEFDVGDNSETIMRLFLKSTTGNQTAVEVPHAMWSELYEAMTAAMQTFSAVGFRQ
jgi:hypothetical protein